MSYPRALILDKVDVVLLESVDGRIHLEQAIPVFKAGKPVFIDKPFAGSLADAVAMADLAKRYNVPCFSCSSIRFSPTIQSLLDNEDVGEIAGAITWGPCSIQDNIPDLFFYGIHGVEGTTRVMVCKCSLHAECISEKLTRGCVRHHAVGESCSGASVRPACAGIAPSRNCVGAQSRRFFLLTIDGSTRHTV